MSVFSKIKLSKRAAKEHKEKGKEKEREPAKVPYKHIPTHAAFDALSGAPSSWKHEDRPKIKEQHKRRSQMDFSRTASAISTTSYMNAATTPHQPPPLPRNSSYHSYNPTWFDRGGDLNYSLEKTELPPKRPKASGSRGHSYNDSGVGSSVGPSPLGSNQASEGTSSPEPLHPHPFLRSGSVTPMDALLTSNAEASPVMSSGNSTSSSDNLEMAQYPNRLSTRQQPIVYAEKDIFDKLHTSTTRKLGEAPLSDSPPVVTTTPAAVSPAAAQPKPKKNRWSLLGKRHSTIAAM